MSEPFVGEIRMFAGTFSPRGWAFCDGQLIAVHQNDALFSLLGTIYGGDGRTTFGLPDMRGRIPVHAGTGPGLSPHAIGAKSGAQTVTLSTFNIPSHNHEYYASTAEATTKSPTDNVVANGVGTDFYKAEAPNSVMASASINQAGGTPNAAHTNMMPALCVNFIISLFGIYPSRQ